MWTDPHNVMATIGVALLSAGAVVAFLIHRFLNGWCC